MNGNSSQNLERLVRLARKSPPLPETPGEVEVSRLATRVAAHWSETVQARRSIGTWDRLSSIAAAAALAVALFIQFDARGRRAEAAAEPAAADDIDAFTALASAEPTEFLP